jgi:hypothetical protein
MMASPLGAAFALTTFPFTPIVHAMLARFVLLAPCLLALLACFVALRNMVFAAGAFALTPLVLALLACFVVLPSLLLRLSGRNVVVAPSALLAVVPTGRTAIVIGDVLGVFVVAPTVVIAVMAATLVVVGKGAARKQRDGENSCAKKTALHKASAVPYVHVVFRMGPCAQNAGSACICAFGHDRKSVTKRGFEEELLTRE